MSLLDVESNLIHIPLYYREISNGQTTKLKILKQVDAKLIMQEDSKDHDVQVLNTWWKSISWKEQNEIVSLTMRVDPVSGQQDMDVFAFRDLRIKKCLYKWDLKHQDKPVPPSPEYIDQLPAEVVTELSQLYDEAIGFDEDEEKK